MIIRTPIFIICLYSLCLLAGCKNSGQERHTRNEEFLSKYGNTQFDNFKNRSVFVREWNRGQGPTIMIVNHGTDTGDCSLPFTIVLDKEGDKAKEIKGNWMDRTGKCNVDTSVMIELAVELKAMQISHITVDSNHNVFVQVVYGEGTPDLVKFSDRKYITDKYKTGWKLTKTGWYERTGF